MGNSDSANVTGNQISNNGGIGVSLDFSQKGIVQDNKIENNTVGIKMIWVHEYLLLDNDVANQSSWGIYVASYSNSNTVYHNNFDNRNQVESDLNSIALWSDVYPSGGNCWSDYNGTDLSSGIHQNVPGSDGIGDTNYTINSKNTDYLPLMNPSRSPQPPYYSLTIVTSLTVGGTTNPPPNLTYNYSQGQTVPVYAIPHTGYYLDHWEVDGVNVGTSNQ